MITDRQTHLARDLALTTGTQVSDAYDAGLARDIARGHPIRAKVVVKTTFADGTNETFNLVESANADLSSPTVLATSGAVLEASLTAGASVLDVVIPKTSKRYVGFTFVASGTHTAGAVDAMFVLDSDSGDSFPVETGI